MGMIFGPGSVDVGDALQSAKGSDNNRASKEIRNSLKYKIVDRQHLLEKSSGREGNSSPSFLLLSRRR